MTQADDPAAGPVWLDLEHEHLRRVIPGALLPAALTGWRRIIQRLAILEQISS